MKHVLTIIKRSEQNPADCLSVEDLFPSDQSWEEAFEACQCLPVVLWACRGMMGTSATALFVLLELE